MLSVLCVCGLWALFVVVQLVGLDWGNQHPDELGNLDQAAWSLSQRWPGPAYYFYPHGLFALLQLMALPEIVTRGLDGAAAWLVAAESDVLLRARAVLVLLSSAVVPSTWWLARRAGAGRVEALFAAGLVATSWQIGLHARFIATDALVTALTTTTTALLVTAAVTKARAPLFAAAALIGVAAGVKYYPVVLVLVGAGVCVVSEPSERRLRSLFVSAVSCALAFVVTTPGAILEPGLIVRALAVQRQIYGAGWFAYTVDGPVGVVSVLAEWFLFASLSKVMALSALLGVLAVVGLVVFARARPTRIVIAAGAVLVFPFLLQSSFLSRNMLPLIPFIALAAARGLSAITERLPARSGVIAAGVAALVVVCVNAAAVSNAALSIRRSAADPRAALTETATYVDAHRAEVFLASPKVAAALAGRDHVVPSDHPRAHEARWLLAQPEELWVEWEWPGNDAFLVVRSFGPQEIDLRYTPSWRGRPRVVLLSLERARQAGAALDFRPVASSPPPVLPFHLLER